MSGHVSQILTFYLVITPLPVHFDDLC